MKIARCLSILTLTAAVLSGCGGGKGSSAPAPVNLTVTPEDGQITLNWDAVSGVQYRAYCAPGASVDNYSWYTTLGGASRADYLDRVLPPFTVDTLQNGLQYACTVDGRYDNGPAGAPALSASATPRSAGVTWASASDTGLRSSALRAVAAGTLSGFTTDRFLAISAGALQVTDDYIKGTWAPVSTLPSNLRNLTTVMVNSGRVYVADDAGVVAYSSDLQNWVYTLTLGGPVRKLTAFGAQLIAVGDAGLIRTSTDGNVWTEPTSVPSNTPVLRDAAYSEAGYWVTVGDGGTVWICGNANPAACIWSQASNSSSVANLSSVAALKVQTPNSTTVVYKLVAVGSGGAIGYSDASNPQTWTWQTLAPQNDGIVDLKQVVAGGQILVQIDSVNSKIYSYYGGQFMVAGAGGKIWRSGDALAWNNSSWQEMSGYIKPLINPLAMADAVSLLRYNKLGRYAGGTVRTAYTWLFYLSDGTGLYAR